MESPQIPTINTITEIAKKIIISKGKHAPQAILFNENTKTAMPVVFTGVEARQIVPLLRHYVKQVDADMYYFINEAWMRMNVDPKDPFIRPSEAPDKKEVLIIVEFHKNMAGNDWRILPFYHQGKKIIFDEPLPKVQGMELVSHFNVYLETEGIDERIDRTFKPVKPFREGRKDK
jgi:hypothetical protein